MASIQVTVTFEYPINKSSYATEENTNPTNEECAAIDKMDLEAGKISIDELLAGVFTPTYQVEVIPD